MVVECDEVVVCDVVIVRSSFVVMVMVDGGMVVVD